MFGLKGATFKVGRGHTRVILPVQMLVTEDEYKKQKQQEQLRKRGLEVSVNTAGEIGDVELHRQHELIAEANAQLSKSQKQRQMTEGTRVSEALRGEENLAAGTGGHHAPSTDPVVGMSENELKQQVAEMERFEREKEAKDSQRAQGRWHPISQGAVPGVSFGAPAGGGQPHDESTGGLHIPQQDGGQTRNTENGAGASEQPRSGHPGRVEYPAQIQRQMSDPGRWEPGHEGGDSSYQNLSGGPPCQHLGVRQQQLGHVGLPSYQHQDSGSRHQAQYSNEYPRNAPHPALAVPPLYSNTPLEQPTGSPTARPRQSTPAQPQQQQSRPESQIPSWLSMDTIVVLKNSDPPISGVVRFIGNMPGFSELIGGLELVRSCMIVCAACTSSVITYHCLHGRTHQWLVVLMARTRGGGTSSVLLKGATSVALMICNHWMSIPLLPPLLLTLVLVGRPPLIPLLLVQSVASLIVSYVVLVVVVVSLSIPYSLQLWTSSHGM